MYQIAIVDDNEAWCFTLATRLRQYGYNVSTFIDTDLFLRAAEQFDLVLMDFSMPPRRYQTDTDGPDVIRKLKQRIAHPPLVILISSFFTEDILRETADLGLQADAYLSKSVESAELIQKIESLLASRRFSASDRSEDEINHRQPSSSLESDNSLKQRISYKKLSRSH